AAGGPAALSPSPHPRKGRPRDDGAFARSALPAARSSRHRARLPPAGREPWRCADDEAAVSRSREAVGASGGARTPEVRIRRTDAAVADGVGHYPGAGDVA